MTKKHFIALADAIRHHNVTTSAESHFNAAQVETLAIFCENMNHGFNRNRWLDYIAGKCGPNGGAK
jgi:hypothetical protein